MLQTIPFGRGVAATLALLAWCSPGASQAIFTPIPSPFAPVVMPYNGACYESGSSGSWSPVRVSADGRTVTFVAFRGPLTGTSGAAPRAGVIWTEQGGTQVIVQDLFSVAWQYFVPTGISADGNTVVGDSWVWNRTTGLRSLYSTIQSLAVAAGFSTISQVILSGCSESGTIVGGVLEDPITNRSSYFLWQIGAPVLQVLPGNAQLGISCSRFSAISGNGLVMGGSVLQPLQPAGNRSTAALANAAGTVPISGLSTGCNYTGVWDVNLDGTVAVGTQETRQCSQAAFRYTSAGGLVVIGPDGSAAYACSAVGDVVVGDYLSFGVAGLKPFLWTPAGGFRDLQTELIANWGLGAALQGWTLLGCSDVSADGRVIVGTARNPAGCEQAFVVRFPTVPAAAVSYGSGCSGPQGVLQAQSTRLPYVGSVAEIRCSGLGGGGLPIGLLGFVAQALPLSSVLAQGVPNCDLLVAPDQSLLLPPATGELVWTFPIPPQQSLLGVRYLQQVLRLDAAANGSLQAVRSSNGLRLTIGRF